MDKQISRDDLEDIKELTMELENTISEILEDNEHDVSMSALMGAMINTVMHRCNKLREVVTYRNAFVNIFDSVIQATIYGRDE